MEDVRLDKFKVGDAVRPNMDCIKVFSGTYFFRGREPPYTVIYVEETDPEDWHGQGHTQLIRLDVARDDDDLWAGSWFEPINREQGDEHGSGPTVSNEEAAGAVDP